MSIVNIYNIIEQNKNPLTKKEINSILKVSAPIIRRYLKILEKLEIINDTKKGKYSLITKGKNFKKVKNNIKFLLEYYKAYSITPLHNIKNEK